MRHAQRDLTAAASRARLRACALARRGGVCIKRILTLSHVASPCLASRLPSDFNQLVHNCTHAHAALAGAGEEAQLAEVCRYVDRLLSLLRPRSLLLLAVDGVAPAAKLAQQRTRRYTAALRRSEAARHAAAAARELAPPPHLQPLLAAALAPPPFDSNVITPGTPFMARMEAAVRSFLETRLASGHVDWAGLEVLWSPSSEPGEGEHKIMQFLRLRRAQPSFRPDACRAIVGQDADLLLLALATHEPSALVVRECFGAREAAASADATSAGDEITHHPLELVSVAALREALRWEFAPLLGGPPKDPRPDRAGMTSSESDSDPDDDSDGDPAAAAYAADLARALGMPIPERGAKRPKANRGGGGGKKEAFDFECLVDDLVVISSFAGNDFLPPLPCLDIHDRPSGLDALWRAYAAALPRGGGGGFVSRSGELIASRLEYFLKELARGEEARLKARAAAAERASRAAARRAAAQAADDASSSEDDTGDGGATRADFDVEVVRIGARHRVLIDVGADVASGESGERSAADDARAVVALAAEARRRASERVDAALVPLAGAGGDRLRMGEPGDAARYYAAHFGASDEATCAAVASDVAREYLRGVGFVAAYYFRGAGAAGGAPWRWAYPHDAAPLARALPAAAAASRALLPRAAAEARAADKAARAAPQAVPAGAARRRLRAARRAAAKDDAATRDEAAVQARAAAADAAEQAAWDAAPDGPVPVELQLLAVIPPESAAACFPPRCARVLRSALGSDADDDDGDDSSPTGCGDGADAAMPRLAPAFPRVEATRLRVRRGRRFAWQAVVVLPPAPFATLSAALAAASDGDADSGADDADDEEDEKTPAATPPVTAPTVMLCHAARHPTAPLALAAVLSAGAAAAAAAAEPAAGGAPFLLHAAAWEAAQAADSNSGGEVLVVPIELYPAAMPPPFGGGRLAGATEPARVVTRALWRAAQTGQLAPPRWRPPPRRNAPQSQHQQTLPPPQPLPVPPADGNGFWPPGWRSDDIDAMLPPSLLTPPPAPLLPSVLAPPPEPEPAPEAEAAADETPAEAQEPAVSTGDDEADELAALAALLGVAYSG